MNHTKLILCLCFLLIGQKLNGYQIHLFQKYCDKSLISWTAHFDYQIWARR